MSLESQYENIFFPFWKLNLWKKRNRLQKNIYPLLGNSWEIPNNLKLSCQQITFNFEGTLKASKTILNTLVVFIVPLKTRILWSRVLLNSLINSDCYTLFCIQIFRPFLKHLLIFYTFSDQPLDYFWIKTHEAYKYTL